jgi:hypothetical protein
MVTHPLVIAALVADAVTAAEGKWLVGSASRT